jgi:hypothetical protein
MARSGFAVGRAGDRAAPFNLGSELRWSRRSKPKAEQRNGQRKALDQATG